MKKCLFLRVLTMVIISVLMLSGIAVAADTAEVVFGVTEKTSDIIELEVTVKNTAFRIFQTAVRYDKNVVVPVDEAGNEATTFEDFATREEKAEVFSEIGLDVEPDKGLFGFTLFLMPGVEGEDINEKTEYEAYGDGIKLFKFRFKRISDGKPAFEIAFEDENKAYQPALKEGLLLLSMGDQFDVNVSFVYEDGTSEQVVVKPVVPQQEIKLTAADRKKDVICMQVGKARAISKGKKAIMDSENTRVVPYIANDRTLVPIRFITEALGAEILWEDGWTYCIIKKEEKEIKLNFNSAEFEVNGEKITFDAPVELTQDRTMVPVRFVSEHLDCDVYWSERHKAVVIAPKDNPWQADREAEITALNEMLVSITGILP